MLEFSATANQERFLLLEEQHGDVLFPHMTAVLALPRDVTAKDVQESLSRVVAEQETLRLSFRVEESRAHAHLVAPTPFPLRLLHTKFGPEEIDAEIQRLVDQQHNARFDLDQAPLLRACLLVGPTCSPRLVVTAHHAIMDGWGFAVLFRQLCRHLNRTIVGSAFLPQALPPLRERYEAEAAFLASPEAARRRSWWKAHLERAEPPARTGGDRLDRPPASCEVFLEPDASRRLDERLAREGLSFTDYLTALYALALARIDGRASFTLSRAYMNRPGGTAALRTIDFFSNFVPMVLQVEPGMSAVQVAGDLRGQWETINHNALPIWDLIKTLRPDLCSKYGPLASTSWPSRYMMNVLPAFPGEHGLGEGAVEILPQFGTKSNFADLDQNLGAGPTPEGTYRLNLTYNERVFNAEQAGHILGELSEALRSYSAGS